MTSSTAARRSPAGPRRKRARIIPDQHGAWGFLLLPVVLGIIAGGWSAAVPALVVAWVAAYPCSWALSGALTAPRPERFHRALAVWSAIAVPAAVLAVVLRPWLVFVGAAYAGAFLVNLWFARRRQERALANDLVLVAECTAMVPVVAGVAAAGGGWSVPFAAMTETTVLVLTLACGVTLVGSTLHVKSLIRERNNARFALASGWYAALAVVVMTGVVMASQVGLVLVVPFLVQALRASAFRDPRMRPARIGIIELVCLIVLAVCAAVAI